MTTIEKNETIMKFLGIEKVDGIYKNSYDVMSFFPVLNYSRVPEDLHFDCSWDWLMPVIEKLLDFSCDMNKINEHLIRCDIVGTYNCVVDCIKNIEQ